MLVPQLSPPMLIQCSLQKDVLVCRVSGNLRETRYQEKQQQYNRLMSSLAPLQQPRLLFDLSECRLLDSVTVGVLISLSQTALKNDGRVGLCGISAETEATLSSLMLLEPRHRQLSWTIYADCEEAFVGLSRSGDQN